MGDEPEATMYDVYALLGSHKIAAEHWINDYARRLSDKHNWKFAVTAEDLINTAKSNLVFMQGQSVWTAKMGEWLLRPQFMGVEVEPEFWNQLSNYLEYDIPKSERQNFFAW